MGHVFLIDVPNDEIVIGSFGFQKFMVQIGDDLVHHFFGRTIFGIVHTGNGHLQLVFLRSENNTVPIIRIERFCENTIGVLYTEFEPLVAVPFGPGFGKEKIGEFG